MKSRWLRRAREFLASRHAARWIALLSVVLLAKCLLFGLILDDWFHRMVLLEHRDYLGGPLHPLDLFAFFPEDPAFRTAGMESGLWPWWVSEVRLRFFRPVTAITHYIDYRLWPGAPWVMHLHSLLWYGALVAAVGDLFRRTLTTRWVAGLALLIFAVDGGHPVAVSWLASRNMIVATLFGVLAITTHCRAAEDGWKPGRWLSPLFFLLALLSAEFGIGALGFVVAHAAVMQRGALAERLRSVLPHLLVLVAWQVLYSKMGYGAAHTGLYTHPLHEPGQFAVALFERAPVLLASQLTLPFADLWGITAENRAPAYALLALVVVLAFAWLFAPQLRADRRARWFAVSALLAVIPTSATFPNGRMLLFVGIGSAPLLAGFVERVATDERRWPQWVAGLLMFRHVVLAALLVPANADGVARVGRVLKGAITSLPDDPPLREETLVVVTSPHTFMSNLVTLFRRSDESFGPPVWPERMRLLAETTQAVTVTRVDDNTIQLEAAEGFLSSRAYQLAWHPDDARPVGYSVALSDCKFEVLEATADSRPRVVRVRFNRPLEDPTFRWVAWQNDSFAKFVPPSPGESVVLPASDMWGVVMNASE